MIVYEITGPNGMKYVGATICKLSKRRREHKHAAKDSKTPLYVAIREYGWSAFRFSVVRECLTSEDMYDLESELILKYKAENRCYNISTYKSGGWRMTTEQIKTMSERLKASADPVKMSEQARQAWLDPEYKNKMRLARSRWALENKGEMDRRRENSYKKMHEIKPVIVVKTKDGTVVGKYKDRDKCAEFAGVTVSSLYRYLRNERNHREYNFHYMEV